MQREERRDHETAPGVARRPFQHQEQQDCVQRVQKYVLVVMRSRVEPEQLDINGVRHPGQRMIIAGVAMRECPENCATGQAVCDVWILGDVFGVVDVGEGMLVDGRIDHNGDGG